MKKILALSLFLHLFFSVSRAQSDSGKKNSTIPAPSVKPQTPKPPFPYNSEDVEYDDPVLKIHYSGTLTYPREGGPFPAALLITGSGLQDRDETILQHKPFAVIADYLTRRGYAVLRVDDRQMGNSTGDPHVTSREFAKDVEFSVAQLRKRKEIDQKRIGLIGHSEGGLIAAMVASSDPSIDFIILLAGPGLKGADLLALQSEAIARSQGVTEKQGIALKNLNLHLYKTANPEADSVKQFQDAWNAYLIWKKNTDTTIIKSLGITDTLFKKILPSELKKLNDPWTAYFIRSDPAVYLSKLSCKVLALNGSKDLQVLPDQNLAGIDSALKKSGAKIYSVQKINGLNHLFQHCKNCSVMEYGVLEESFAPTVLQIMADWLDKNVKQ